MKSVMLSIRPQWCELIANGKKTIEVRKSRPKLDTPFKCYIYCTAPKKFYMISGHMATSMEYLHQCDGKVTMSDLMEYQLHYAINDNKSIGKQPAWLNYMTAVNQSYADFAAGEPESYMVLNRIYNEKNGEIENASTYISPKDYTYIFATNTDTNRDFWVQIGKRIIARRVMSAAQIPLM